MAQFDAGSIVGSMHIDRDPFTEGLALAKKQAEDFEATAINKTVRISEKVNREGNLSPDNISGGDVTKTEHIRVDDGVAKEQLTLFDVESDRATRNRTEKVKVDTKKATSDIDKFSKAAGKLPAGLGLIATSALALGPALVPVGAAVLGVAGALAGGLSTAALGLGAFGLVAKSEFTQVATNVSALAAAQEQMESAQTTSQKAAAVLKLAAAQKVLAAESPAMKSASTALLHFKDVYAQLKKSTEGPVLGVMTQGLNLLSSILPKLSPLITATGRALSGAISQLNKAFGGAGFTKFITFLSVNVGPIIHDLVDTLINFGAAFGNIVEKLNPLTQSVFKNIDNFSKAARSWTVGNGIQKFLDYIQQNGPQIKQFFTNLGTLVKDLIQTFGVMAPISLQLTNTLISMIDALPPDVLAAIAYGLISISLGLKAVKLGSNMADGISSLKQFKKWLTAVSDEDSVSKMGKMSGALKGVGNAAGGLGKIGWAKSVSGLKSFGAAAKGLGGMSPMVLLVVAAVILLALAGYEIYKHWSGISKFFSKLWSDVWGFFAKYHALILQIIFPFIGIPVQIYNNWGNITAFFKKLWSDIVDLFTKHWLLILEILFPFTMWPFIIYQHWHQIIGWLEGVWKDVYNGVKDGWNAVTSWLGGLPKWFSDLWNNIKNGVINAWNDTIHWIESIPGRIESIFADAHTWLLNVGGDVIRGFWNGLKNVWNDVVNWLTSKVEALPGFVKTAFGIKSPSTVFHAIGMNTGQGFHNGLKASWGTMEEWLANASKNLGVDANLNTALSGVTPGTGFMKGAKVTPAEKQHIDTITNLTDELAKMNKHLDNSQDSEVSLYLTPHGTEKLAKVIKTSNDRSMSRLGG